MSGFLSPGNSTTAYVYMNPVVSYQSTLLPAQSESLNLTAHTSYAAELLKMIPMEFVPAVYLKSCPIKVQSNLVVLLIYCDQQPTAKHISGLVQPIKYIMLPLAFL